MEYESPIQVAERFGVTVRAVQKWAATGKLKGAKKVGRDWLIPKGLPDPRVALSDDVLPVAKSNETFRQTMPLMNGAFSLGQAMEYIESIKDEDDKNVALGEYYYYTGQPELSAKYLEPYLSSDEPALRHAAEIVLIFVNIALGRTNLARFALLELEKYNKEGLRSEAPIEVHAMGVVTAHALAVLFHRDTDPEVPKIEDYLRYLSGGMKLWACYILAYRAYLDKEYDKALTTTNLALSLVSAEYPLPAIYCKTIAIMSLLGLKRIDEAKVRFDELWKYARADGFVEIISEHYGELQGVVDVSLKRKDSDTYEMLMQSVRTFGVNWIKLYNQMSDKSIADNLSSTEFTVAMLYNRGWSAQEIATHLSLSEHTVRSYIKAIYVKLGISDKKALANFMLQ